MGDGRNDNPGSPGMRKANSEETGWTVGPKRALPFLLALAGIVLLLGIAVEIAEIGFGHRSLYGLQSRLDLDGEATLGSYVSALMLLTAAGLLALIALRERRAGSGWALHWAVLAAGFLWLSLDEAIALHELMNRPIRSLLDAPGFISAWTLGGAIIVLLVGIAYARFLLSLDRRHAVPFLIAGALYVGGAVGADSLAGEIISSGLRESWLWSLELVMEEAAEMGGVILFIHALLDYLGSRGSVLQLRFEAAPYAARAGRKGGPARAAQGQPAN